MSREGKGGKISRKSVSTMSEIYIDDFALSQYPQQQQHHHHHQSQYNPQQQPAPNYRWLQKSRIGLRSPLTSHLPQARSVGRTPPTVGHRLARQQPVPVQELHGIDRSIDRAQSRPVQSRATKQCAAKTTTHQQGWGEGVCLAT